MDPEDRPKRRLVTYVTEEVYNQLLAESKSSKRSISSITEMKILQGISTGTAQHGQAQSSEYDIKNSVIETVANLPEDTLQILARRLSDVLAHSITAQHMPARTGTVTKPTSIRKKSNADTVKDLAIRVQKFMNSNKISQRGFKEKYDVDVTPLTRWINGTKGMSDERIAKLESIISSPA